TVLIFSSDNGGNLQLNTNKQQCGSYVGNNFPLRGGKFTYWEGGIRVPGFIYSPLIPSSARGTTYQGLVSATDWFSTLATIARVNIEPRIRLMIPDSLDVWSAVLNNNP